MAVMPVERGKIREYAIATKNERPEYVEDPRASIPPTFLATVVFWDNRLRPMTERPEVLDACRQVGIEPDITNFLSLEQEYVFHGPPPRAGDILETVPRFDRVVTKDGPRSRMVLIHMAMEFRGPDGTLRAECLYTSAYRTVLEPAS
jgi:hypothetical protein